MKSLSLVRLLNFAIVALIGLGSLTASAKDEAVDRGVQALTPIASLDVPRYMGTWYEIAKFPNWFQKKCTGNTKAEYRLLTDGRVQVTNRCRLGNGEMDEAIGSARQLGDSKSPRLEVRFAPAWLSFIPAVWGDYWVIDLDSEYQLVAVGEPSRQFLWVLSRTPRVDSGLYDALLGRLSRKGYDVRGLERTLQEN